MGHMSSKGTCPFPHTLRDQVWLGLGALAGAGGAWIALRATRPPEKPFCVAITVKVHKDKIDEAKQILLEDAKESRKESKCLRFDVVHGCLVKQADGKEKWGKEDHFFFYEVYTNGTDAMDEHKNTPHWKAWNDFKERCKSEG